MLAEVDALLLGLAREVEVGDSVDVELAHNEGVEVLLLCLVKGCNHVFDMEGHLVSVANDRLVLEVLLALVLCQIAFNEGLSLLVLDLCSLKSFELDHGEQGVVVGLKHILELSQH